MTTRTNTIQHNANGQKKSLKDICNRAWTAKSDWPDKEEFLDVIYWSRQIFGILLGIIWGIIPLKGFLGIALFAAISCGVVYLYAINFQNIDEELYGGAWELVKEGFMTSFAGFLVTWIIFYTGLHYDSIMESKGV
uniref:Rab5-interacting protein n=1 Tax=Glossina brevipalpis TaxID=37001 RepID=A0A1A9WI38_9MUSC